jgi:hypothetical protein
MPKLSADERKRIAEYWPRLRACICDEFCGKNQPQKYLHVYDNAFSMIHASPTISIFNTHYRQLLTHIIYKNLPIVLVDIVFDYVNWI